MVFNRPDGTAVNFIGPDCSIEQAQAIINGRFASFAAADAEKTRNEYLRNSTWLKFITRSSINPTTKLAKMSDLLEVEVAVPGCNPEDCKSLKEYLDNTNTAYVKLPPCPGCKTAKGEFMGGLIEESIRGLQDYGKGK